MIGTDPDQIAVAPGSLRESWYRSGRRYFRYATESPIKSVYPFLSAAYAVREERWEDVEIQILHHPTHSHNVDRMGRGVRASLDYYTTHFGPYPYGQIRIAEIPRRAGNFARSFPGLIVWSEGFGFLARPEDGGVDYPFAVAAHEVAHQWWGCQYAPANAPGRMVLLETLAHYSAMMVVEKTYGRGHVQRFLNIMRRDYLMGRDGKKNREVPLLMAYDQKHVVYDKGAMVMYALRDYVGEGPVNLALRRLLEKYHFMGPPHPTSLDLYEELKAVTPEPLRYLLKDLFEEVTLWDLRTKEARIEPADAGAYRVTLEVEASKTKVDDAGVEVQQPMDDLVYVGVFGDAPREEFGEPLYLQPHRIRSGQQTISVIVPKAPARAGIDPYHRLIEKRIEDNVRGVTGAS